MVQKLSDIAEEEDIEPATRDNTFVHSPVGLYPSPIGRSTKFGAITKIKSKFRFLGKLLAKSAMDGRMVRWTIITSSILYNYYNRNYKNQEFIIIIVIFEQAFRLCFCNLQLLLI